MQDGTPVDKVVHTLHYSTVIVGKTMMVVLRGFYNRQLSAGEAIRCASNNLWLVHPTTRQTLSLWQVAPGDFDIPGIVYLAGQQSFSYQYNTNFAN